MSDKTIVLITGANQGIGYETAKALAASSTPYHILLCGRSLDRAKAAISTLQSELKDTSSTFTPLQLDITSDASISSAFSTVQASYSHIDVLINNAGASFDSSIDPSDTSSIRAAWNKSWDTNTTGTYIATHTFAPLLLASSSPRLLFVTSGLSSLATASDPENKLYRSPPAGWPKPPGPSFSAYRSSKAGMNMMAVEWERILKADGVKVWCISPGLLATGLGGDREMLKKMGAGEPRVGGEFIRDVVEGERDADTGRVVNKGGVQPW